MSGSSSYKVARRLLQALWSPWFGILCGFGFFSLHCNLFYFVVLQFKPAIYVVSVEQHNENQTTNVAWRFLPRSQGFQAWPVSSQDLNLTGLSWKLEIYPVYLFDFSLELNETISFSLYNFPQLYYLFYEACSRVDILAGLRVLACFEFLQIALSVQGFHNGGEIVLCLYQLYYLVKPPRSEWPPPKIDDTGVYIPSKSSDTFTNISWIHQCISFCAHLEHSSTGSGQQWQISGNCLLSLTSVSEPKCR